MLSDKVNNLLCYNLKMLGKISEQYLNARLIGEKMVHSGSLLSAMLGNDGITILHLAQDDFLIKQPEFDYFLSLFDLWDKHAITLPGFRSGGSSGCGITLLEYYPGNSKKRQSFICAHNEVLKYLKTEGYFMLRKAIDEGENEMGIRLKDKLNYNGLEGHISRFNLYVTRQTDNNKQLVSFSKSRIEGFREMADYYSARKQDYYG